MNIDSNENHENIQELNENKEISTTPLVKILKKRGRKPTSKVLDIQSMESKNITSSLDPEKECLIIHLPISVKDIEKQNKKPELDKINELSEKNSDSIFIELSETAPHNKESTLTSELQITETSENKKKCYNCQYLTLDLFSNLRAILIPRFALCQFLTVK